jgi:hypothetical protein
MTSVTEVARAIRKAGYFSKGQSLRRGSWFSFAGLTSEERDELICWTTTVDKAFNIGLRGRMWAITGLLGPLGAEKARLSQVVDDIAKYATLNETDDAKLAAIYFSRCRATLHQLIQRLVVAAKPGDLKDDKTVTKVGKGAPLTCSETVKNSNCILWAVEHVVKVACAADRKLVCRDPETLRKAMLDVLFETCIDEVRIPRPYACPADLFLALAQAIGLPEAQEISLEAGPATDIEARTEDHTMDIPSSYIQPGLQQYARKGSAQSRAPDIDRTVATITRSLGSIEPTTDDCATLFLLWGKEQSGKKSVIGDLLRSLRIGEGAAEQYRFPLRAPDGSVVAELPIFAVVTQRVHYRDLLIELFVFLNLNKPLEHGEEQVIDETLRAEAEWMLKEKPNGRTLLEEIGRLHAQVPALFIFSDVHGFSRDGLQTMLVENGIYKLLDLLTRTKGRSRFLITQEQDNYTEWERLPTDQVRRARKMDMPQLDRFAWYPSEASVARYDGPEFGSLRARNQGNPRELSGNGLLSMSALLALEPETERVVGAFSDYVLGLDETDETAGLEDRHQRLNTQLFLCFNRRGIDDVILMIAATSLTDDSLSDPTLKRMIQKWRGLDDAELERVWPTVCAALRTLEDGTQTLFVSGKPNPHVDPEELSYREELTLSDPNRPPVLEWRMSRSVARALLDHVRQMPNVDKTLRQVFRLLAQESHRRAQIKRVRRVQADSSRLEIARDIQSLQALLASLPSDLNARGDLDQAPFGTLRLRVEDVFGTAADHEPELALRYAVLLLLRRDIDPDHMLSMVTDQDQLRLNLYLRLFLPLGQIHTFSVRDLRGQAALQMLPVGVPQHLFGSLRKSEIMELLLSIAMAAFLSQLEEVVAWAHRLSESLMTDMVDSACHTAYQRLRCVRFDAAILQGVAHSPAETASATDHSLRKVQKQVQAAWLAWHKAYTSVGIGREDEILARVAIRLSGKQPESGRESNQMEQILATPSGTARGGSLTDGLRLLARAAELNWLVNDERPWTENLWQDSLYAAIIALENHIARERGDAHRPVTLSGRTGRRIIRALTGDALVLAYPPSGEQSVEFRLDENSKMARAIRAIWHTNAARLGQQYAGADRLYTLLDYARVRASEDRLPVAARVLQDCVKALDDSLISAQGRLEIQLADHACRVSLELRDWHSLGLMPSPVQVADHLSSLDWLLRRAEDHRLRPLVCEANLVFGRALVLQGATLPVQTPDRFSRAKRQFSVAEGDARAIGYKPAEKCARDWICFIDTL